MKRVSFIFFFCLSIVFNISAQSLTPKCLFIPEPEEEVTTIQGLPEDTINGIYLIPVVFHVIYNDTIDNISDFQIFNGLQLLNEDFRKLNADTTDIITPFKNIAADAKIELD